VTYEPKDRREALFKNRDKKDTYGRALSDYEGCSAVYRCGGSNRGVNSCTDGEEMDTACGEFKALLIGCIDQRSQSPEFDSCRPF
jgi:hypothetical protein